jgi:D-inositol-3-phosphate glycosyltransferase
MAQLVTTVSRDLRRVAILSVHTSPLDQPGTGDAGGMNVYVAETAKGLARRGIETEIFTRAVCRASPPVAELAPGVLVRNVVAGPFEELDKADLPVQVCPFTFEVLRAEAAHAPGRYDLVHGHYWLSGLVGAVAAERWGVPLIQSMHTLGKVKNAARPLGGALEPDVRIRGETEVAAVADRLIANTPEEARELTELYGADHARIRTITPGVDLATFRPGSKPAARHRLGLDQDGIVVVFAGRVQPLKAPDVVLRAAARMLADDPSLASRLTVVMIGGPSGQERSDPDRMRELAARLGIGHVVRHEPPCPQPELAAWYRAATVVLQPSHSESFGLVALEAQSCGTPVIAASVGGLRTAVRDGESGILIEGHDPADYARAIRQLAANPGELERLSRGATRHAGRFGWPDTVDRLIAVYTGAMEEVSARVGA